MGLLNTLRSGAGKINSLLYPGMLTGTDPQAAQAAASQAMMQMGAGLLGGAPFGQAYGAGSVAGGNVLENLQREALLRQREQEKQADLAYREWQKKMSEDAVTRQKKLDQVAMGDRISDRMYRREQMERQAILDQQNEEYRRQSLAAQQAAAGRAEQTFQLQQQAQRAALERQAQEDAIRQQIIQGSYADPGKARGGGPGQRRKGGITDPVEQLVVQSGSISDIANIGKLSADDKKRQEGFAVYEQGMRGLLEGLSSAGGMETGPIAGLFPALSSGAQKAEGGVAAMAPILKQLFRSAGEGTFTDKDQELLLGMVPTRTDKRDVQIWKAQNIDQIVRAKLGMPQIDYGQSSQQGMDEGMAEMPPANLHKGGYLKDSEGNRYRSDGMRWVKL